MANKFRHRRHHPKKIEFYRFVSTLFLAVVLISCCPADSAHQCDKTSAALKELIAHGDNLRALQQAELALKSCKCAGNTKKYWNRYITRAQLLNQLGRYREALGALEDNPPVGNDYIYHRVCRRMEQALAAQKQGDYAKAETLLDDAEVQAGPDLKKYRSTLFARKTYVFLDDQKLSEAEQAFQRVILNDGIDRDHYLLLSGYILRSASRFEEAAEKYEEALPYVRNTGDLVTLGKTFNNLGDVYYHLGDLARASGYLKQAVPLLDKGGDRTGLRICLGAEGAIAMDSGHYTEAADYFQRALHIALELEEPKSQTEELNNLAAVAIENKDWKLAESYNERALKSRKMYASQDAGIYSMLNQARISAGQNQYSRTFDTLKLICEHPQINAPLRLAAEELYLAIYRRLRDESNARAHYQTALSLSDQVWTGLKKDEDKLAWFSSRNTLNQEWVRFLVEMNRTDEALQAAEASRIRLMLDRMGKRAVLGTNGTTPYSRLAQGQDAVLVSYWLAPEVSYAWIVKPQKTQLVKLAGENEITRLVAAYGGFLEENGDPHHTDNSAGDRLAQAVLEPILPYVRGAKRIILVPDGSLHALNFETLRTNGRYWIEDVALTIAPSLNLLGGTPLPQPTRNQTVFAMGDAEPSDGFPKLPSASREIEGIAALFPGSIVFRGSKATPAAYLTDTTPHTFIHFAAHASANSEQPLDSAVILSPGASDGRLTARDLLKKTTHAKLVTISACRSAGVRSYRGEGLVGFAWVFLQTGAHGVIAGLWDASDDATARIMTGLYTRIAGGMTPPAALREAKLELVHGGTHFDHPYYWAPFQYYLGATQ